MGLHFSGCINRHEVLAGSYPDRTMAKKWGQEDEEHQSGNQTFCDGWCDGFVTTPTSIPTQFYRGVTGVTAPKGGDIYTHP
jgi:hypothetical protein